MKGLMQDWPLTVDRILDHAKRWHANTQIVTRSVEGDIVRTSYSELHSRAKRVSSALKVIGIAPGDRIGTLAWNTSRHLEIWYGTMGIGAVCHTLNPRLFAEQLVYLVNHAEDRVIFVDRDLAPLLERSVETMPSVRHIVIMTDREGMRGITLPRALCYEDLLAESSDNCIWGDFDETAAAGLCYTSGTTGNPKGVLYSHRSNFLHTLTALNPDILGIDARDVVMPVVPIFHANGWGIPFAAPAVGSKLVMPGPRLDGTSVHELIESEGVTFAAAVPTVWQMLLDHLRLTGATVATLKRVTIGGSAVPESLVRAFQDEYGVEVRHGWGMTELSPTGAISSPTAASADLGREDALRQQLKQGRPPLGVDLKLVGNRGERLPHDGKTNGRLLVAGPAVAAAYFNDAPSGLLDSEGFFDTGDVGTIDCEGFLEITDRVKDVIKSGGEWISSIAIENVAMGHPAVKCAAVIGVAHPKWDERPLLLVEPCAGEEIEPQEILDFLAGKIAKWWMPDEVVLRASIPLGATGKTDKKLLRDAYRDHVLPTVSG